MEDTIESRKHQFNRVLDRFCKLTHSGRHHFVGLLIVAANGKAELTRQARERFEAIEKDRRETPRGWQKIRTVPREPRPADKVNVSEPSSTLTPTHSGFIQGYNAQVVVEADVPCGLIVAAEVVRDVGDQRQLEPMVEQAVSNLGQAPSKCLPMPVTTTPCRSIGCSSATAWKCSVRHDRARANPAENLTAAWAESSAKPSGEDAGIAWMNLMHARPTRGGDRRSNQSSASSKP
jgi:hypothetical protein